MAEEFVGFHVGELMSGFETSYLGELSSFCCLDSIFFDAKMTRVRTTVTIDADTAALLQEEVARTGLSFKEVLNRAVRRALGPRMDITRMPITHYTGSRSANPHEADHFFAPLTPSYFRRSEPPFRSILIAVPASRSSRASATLGSPMTSCHLAIGSWLVTMVDRAPARSSMTSSRSC